MAMAIESKAKVSSEADKELDEEPGEVIESAPPLMVGKEREINNSGLKKKLIKLGVGWETPEFGYEVTVHYVGTLLDGTKFESTRDGDQPLTFKLGHGQVVKGLNMGMVTMKKGEIALFTMPSDLGYGNAGRDGVPADSIVQFEVELISWITVVEVTKDGGIIKRILEKGQSDRQPSELDEVLVRYQIMQSDGIIVAETPEEGMAFYVKDGHLIPALPKAIKTMKVGEKANLNVQSQYWCNDIERKANDMFSSIPRSSTLSINLELISLKPVIDVCGDSKVIKKILQEGESLVAAAEGAVVSEESIDILIKIKGKLAKKERRHLDDARQEKQVREHVLHQVQDLPPTKSQVLERMKTPMHPKQIEGVDSQPADTQSKGGTSSGPLSLPPTKKRRATLQVPTPPDSVSNRPLERRSSFLSADYEGKVALIQELAQKWELAPAYNVGEVPSTLKAAQVYFMEGAARAFFALRSVPSQRVAEAELNSLREQTRHNKWEIESLRERIKAEGRKIWELEYKMGELERRFEADKALMEREAYKAQLNAANTSFEKGRETMMELMTRAAKRYDGGKGLFISDWKILLDWTKVIELEDANAHAQRRKEARQEISRSRLGEASVAHPSSPEYIPEDPPEEDVEATHAGEEEAAEADDGAQA